MHPPSHPRSSPHVHPYPLPEHYHTSGELDDASGRALIGFTDYHRVYNSALRASPSSARGSLTIGVENLSLVRCGALWACLWRVDAGTERANPACVRRALGLTLAAATPPGAPLLTRTRALVMQNIVVRFARTQSFKISRFALGQKNVHQPWPLAP